MTLNVLNIVLSTAGRDKGNYYVVVGISNNRVLVADGKYKTIEKPKQKNIKHLQLVCKNSNLLFQNLKNCDIIHTIKNYKQTSKKLLEENSV